MRVAHRLWQFRQLADGQRALVQTEEEREADLRRSAQLQVQAKRRGVGLPRSDRAIATAIEDEIGHDFGTIDVDDQRVRDKLVAVLPRMPKIETFLDAVIALIRAARQKNVVRTWGDLQDAKIGGARSGTDTVFDVLQAIGEEIGDERLSRATIPSDVQDELLRRDEEAYYQELADDDIEHDAREPEGDVDTSFDPSKFASLQFVAGVIDDVAREFGVSRDDEHLQFFARHDPSGGRQSYLRWMMREFAPVRDGDGNILLVRDTIREVADFFWANKQRLPANERDIYQHTLMEAYAAAKALGPSHGQKKQKAREGYQKIFSAGDVTIFRVFSEEASCVLGRGTKWCISATESENFFDHYNNRYDTYIAHVGDQKWAIHTIRGSRKIKILTFGSSQEEIRGDDVGALLTYEAEGISVMTNAVMGTYSASQLKALAGALKEAGFTWETPEVDYLSSEERAQFERAAQSIDGFDLFDVEDAPDRRAINMLRAQYGEPTSVPARESIKPEGMVDIDEAVQLWPMQAFAVTAPHARTEAEAAAVARRVSKNLIARGKMESHQQLLRGLKLFVLYPGGGFMDANGEVYEDNVFELPGRTATFALRDLERQYQVLASAYAEATERVDSDFDLPRPGDVDAVRGTAAALEALELQIQAAIEARASEGEALAKQLRSSSRAASTFRSLFAPRRVVRIATDEGVEDVEVVEEHGEEMDVELDGECVRIPIEIVLCDVQAKEAASWQNEFAPGARMRVSRTFEPEYAGPQLMAGTEVMIDGAHPADHDMELGLVDPDPEAFVNYRVRVNGPQGQSIISLRQFTDGLDLVEGPQMPVAPEDEEEMLGHYLPKPRAPRPERTRIDDTRVRDNTQTMHTMAE